MNKDKQNALKASLKSINASSTASEGIDRYSTLPLDMLGEIESYVPLSPDMPLKTMAELAASNKSMKELYQPILNDAKLAHPLLKAVVEGKPEQLIELVNNNPSSLFKKGQVKDPAGRVFYNVSAYQMMLFLCDDDMLEQILDIEGVMQNFNTIPEKQYQEMSGGGADLIKLNRDPTTIPFEEILQQTETYMIRNQPHAVRFPLMENPDAILYYKDTNDKAHWYYANRETRTITPIQPQPKTKEDTAIFAKLKKSLNSMEHNSSRRSRDDEHNIITKTMNKTLVRHGIQYEQDGKRYRDTRHDFNRYYNPYRECDTLYAAEKLAEGSKVWCKKLGAAQKEVLWLLQRYCETNRPFYPLPDFKSSPFRRSLEINNVIKNRVEDIYSSGHFIYGFGSGFAVYRGGPELEAVVYPGLPHGVLRLRDLIAINRLVEDAKANVIEFKPEESLSRSPSIR